MKYSESVLSSMLQKWPSSIVARQEVGRFTGGTIKPPYIAVLDSRGEGPKGRIKIGKKVAYPVQELIAWLEERTKSCE